MATIKSRLLPCPFCREKNIGIVRETPMMVRVWCTECGCIKRVVTRYLDQALHAWNLREGVLYALIDTTIPQERRHPYRKVP